MDTLIIVLRIISFLTISVISTVLAVIVMEHRVERKKLEMKLKEIDHLNEEINPNYVVLVFDNSHDKARFVMDFGGDLEHNTFHVSKVNGALKSRSPSSSKEDENKVGQERQGESSWKSGFSSKEDRPAEDQQ